MSSLGDSVSKFQASATQRTMPTEHNSSILGSETQILRLQLLSYLERFTDTIVAIREVVSLRQHRHKSLPQEL